MEGETRAVVTNALVNSRVQPPGAAKPALAAAEPAHFSSPAPGAVAGVPVC